MNPPSPPPGPPGSPNRPPAPPHPPALSVERAARAEAIFNSALERPPQERAAFVAAACRGDGDLRVRVTELLAAHERAAGFMQDDAPLSPEIEEQLARLKPEEAGDHIGPYKLLQEIGSGGFGTVWMADQEHPVRRRVALKIIKMGMDTKEVIARFEQERQALALMDHPNIAHVFDAGATQYGRPYFVMELVRGVKITEYCDEQGLSTDERIELFIHVCQAVQHAHQKGIIHRDLKPSNILVTINDGEAVPKVIDFGVAKATQGRLADGTLFTKFEQMIGTPLYMSPEQAEMTSLDVDTRSDIYALGVLLYELLTGRTPIDTMTMARAGMDEIRRLIREVDPPRPSQRLKTLDGRELTAMAKRRHTEAAKLPGALRGDLDWIVMRCLEKDRKRRYDTANGLALDLQRHLRNEVVIARPPTTGYLLGKLIKRNKSAVAAGATVVLALIVGFAVAVWQARRAEREAKRSAAAFDELRESAPAFAEQASGLAAREQFDDAIAKLDYAIKLRPDVAKYLVAKGDLLQCQQKLADAALAYREALRVNPGLSRAEESAKLCDELLAAPPSGQGKLTRESLAKLHLAMQKQQRPAAELMPVARSLGEEKKLLVEYWLARLKDLPVSTDKPLKDRLTVRDDGRLALDLSDTKVVDLSPLAGAPLAVLNVSSSRERGELADLSPLRGLGLVELNLSHTSVADLSPLREMHTLEKLAMEGARVTDLSALGALRLKSLSFSGCPVSDLTPIRKMPLEEMNLSGTRVADLSPLIGMPIKSLDLSMAPVLDFSPLARLPLEKCYLQRNRIMDLSVLRGLPLKELVLWACEDARNYAAIAEIKTLELLLLPPTYRNLPDNDYAAIGSLRTLPNLRQLGSEIMNQMGYSATGSKDVFWEDWEREQAFVPALRKSGIKFGLYKLASGSYSLSVSNQPLRDLSILQGAPISHLFLQACPVSDLTPIRDLKLEDLHLSSDAVADLGPLRAMPLKMLYVRSSKLRDLSPLTGLPLRELYLDGCEKITDLAALRTISTLEKLTVPPHAGNLEVLRDLPGLQMLAFNRNANFVPAATAKEFWKDFQWIARLRAAGIKPKTLRRLEDGTWDVNLDGGNVTDLTILSGAPISTLTVKNNPVTDLNPLRGMPLKDLTINDAQVADLRPLEGMPLETLNLGDNPVASLEPLRGLRLKWVWLYNTQIADLRPLQGMPLQHLNLYKVKVSDLTPLRGMPLTDLKLHECPNLTDLSPLADLKELRNVTVPQSAKNLEFLRSNSRIERISYAEDTKNGYRPDKTAAEFWRDYGEQGWLRALRVSGIRHTATRIAGPEDDPAKELWKVVINSRDFSDCSIFKGADNLRELGLSDTRVTDIHPLGELPLTTLELINAPVTDLSPLRAPILSASLRDLNISNIPASDFSPVSACVKLEQLHIHGSPLTDLELVRGMKLKVLGMGGAKVTDLSPLQGMPITVLHLNGSPVKDLGPLQGMPLKTLRIIETDVADLSPLRGAPLESLEVGRTRVKDLTPLRGMPLQKLHLFGLTITDLSPLRGMPLEDLWLGDSAPDISVLRGMRLKYLKLHDCSPALDFSPLAESNELLHLTLPVDAVNIEVLRTLPKLRRISSKEDWKNGGRPDKTAPEFWQEHDEKAWMQALRVANVAIQRSTKLPDGTWELDLSESTIRDLTPLKGAPISNLNLKKTAVADLSPLRGMPLKKLILDETSVTDLGPLEGMPIEELELRRTRITSLAALRGTPLKKLQLGSQPITDLEPLRGMALTDLGIPGSKVTDLSPLKGMPLGYLDLNTTPVTDLSVVRGMPLTKLRLRACTQLTDLSPLADARDLTSLCLPPNAKDIEFLRTFPKLGRLGFAEDPKSSTIPDKTAAGFWREYDEHGWLRALRKSNIAITSSKQLPDGTWEVNLSASGLTDLTILKGAPISILNVGETAVTDLTPLQKMPLKELKLFRTKVTDLSPLQGLALQHLSLIGTKVTDLSPLRGMPLALLRLNDCPVLTDLTPLAEIKGLTNLSLPPNAQDIEFLRALPKLERLGFKEDQANGFLPNQTAAEFWKEYDAKKK